MKSERTEKIGGSPQTRAITSQLETGNHDFSEFTINEIISAYGAITDYFFKLSRKKNGAEEKKVVGPWIRTLYCARAKKWANRGLPYLNEQIYKAERRKKDPNYMQLFDDIYYDALIEEREKLKSNPNQASETTD